jgi:hypothetical protein
LFVALPCVASPVLNKSDLLFLNRITYGANQDEGRHYLALGKERFLQSQLVYAGDEGLPLKVKQEIAAMDISRLDPVALLAERHLAEQRLKERRIPPSKANFSRR